MITRRTSARQPTKQRLLDEGVRLFAEKGFRETTVGEIEAAAGLEPRRGALYRHYPSKEALLEVALEQHLAGLSSTEVDLDALTSGKIKDQARSLGRWLLVELDRERAILRILEQDGERLPDLRDRFRLSLVDPAYLLTAELARRWVASTSASTDADVDAMSAVLLGGLINYRRSTWTFGEPPAALEEERYLDAWAELCSRTVAAARTRGRTRPRQS